MKKVSLFFFLFFVINISLNQKTKIAKLTFETAPTDTILVITDISYTIDNVEVTSKSQDYFTRTDGLNIFRMVKSVFNDNLDLGDYFFGAQNQFSKLLNQDNFPNKFIDKTHISLA
ncbi:MAG: hypothetical protein ABJK28_05580 [Algibacter sp.]